MFEPTGAVGCVGAGPFQNTTHHRRRPGPNLTASMVSGWPLTLAGVSSPETQPRNTPRPPGLRKRLQVPRPSQLHRVSWHVVLPLPLAHCLLCDIIGWLGKYDTLKRVLFWPTRVKSVTLMCAPTATVKWRVIPDQHSGACKRIKRLYSFQTATIGLHSSAANNINISLILFGKIRSLCLFRQCFFR